jgi:hypothetical protein
MDNIFYSKHLYSSMLSKISTWKSPHGNVHMAIIKEVQYRSIDLIPIPTITFQWSTIVYKFFRDEWHAVYFLNNFYQPIDFLWKYVTHVNL